MVRISTPSFKTLPDNYLLAAARGFCTKLFARFEKDFLNVSDIVNGSNVNLLFASRQILVEGDLLSGRPICFNVFQLFFQIFIVFT